MQDLRLAFRLFRATPVVTAVAVLSLALGIGANTALFSIADSLLLRPLPVDEPERLVLLIAQERPAAVGVSSWNNPAWEQIRERRRELFETAFAFSARPLRFNLASGGQTDLVEGLWASGDYFDALGVRPLLGRTFTADDDRRGGGPDGPVAVVSHSFWQRRFRGAADAVGQTLTIDHVPFTIIGVMPPAFFGAEVGRTFDIAAPLGTEPLMRGKDSALDRATTSWLAVMARLRDDQTGASAQQALRHIRRPDEAMPPGASADARLQYLAPDAVVRPAELGTSAMRIRYRNPVLVILAVVFVVLLVACANIANLLLARAAARSHEFSVRLALGASRWRLGRQLLAESFMLSAASALIGLAVAQWLSGLLLRQLSTYANTVFLDVQLDLRVLAFTTSVATFAALLFGVVPAIRAARSQPVQALRARGQGIPRREPLGFGGALVVGQVSLSLVLVVAAGLFVRTFASMATLDLGFDRDPVLIGQIDIRGSAVEPAHRPALYERVAEAARGIPGVSHAGVSTITPVSGSVVDALVQVANGPLPTAPRDVSYKNVITPHWFATYGTRVVAGRDFDARDQLGSPPVAIVNEAFVRRFLQGTNPIGQRIRQGMPGRQSAWLEIVGVAADATYRSLREPVPPTFYAPIAQQKEPPPMASVSLRSASAPPAELTRAVADVLGRLDPGMAITFTPLRQQVEASLVQERILAILSGFSGVVALLLAGLGLYGLMWQQVSSRRNDIGIRMALGATPATIVRTVLSRAGLLVGAGAVLGLAASIWISKFVAALLYGVEPRDPVTLAWSVAVLIVTGAVAAWMPTHSAARTDPAAVLRDG